MKQVRVGLATALAAGPEIPTTANEPSAAPPAAPSAQEIDAARYNTCVALICRSDVVVVVVVIVIVVVVIVVVAVVVVVVIIVVVVVVVVIIVVVVVVVFVVVVVVAGNKLGFMKHPCNSLNPLHHRKRVHQQ